MSKRDTCLRPTRIASSRTLRCILADFHPEEDMLILVALRQTRTRSADISLKPVESTCTRRQATHVVIALATVGGGIDWVNRYEASAN